MYDAEIMIVQRNAKFFAVSWLVLCLSHAVFADSGIAPTLEDLTPLKAGDNAPDFEVFESDGSAYEFHPDKLQRPVLIIFYRGGWCGACNQQLQDIASIMPAIHRMGVEVLFPNGDRPEILYSSLKAETKTAIEGLDYRLLSDSDLAAARAFGVAYVLADDTLKRYRAREEWDLRDSSMEKYDALPLPSIFLVNTDGVIAFEYHNVDPRIRLSAEALQDAVQKVVAESG